MTKLLKKNEKVELASLSDTIVSVITLGAAWEGKTKGLMNKFLKKPETVDLDFSCVMYDEDGQTHDTVWYANLMSRCGAAKHHGDDTTGEADGLDEQITIDLEKLPPEITTMFFVVSSFSGQTFGDVDFTEILLGHAAGGTALLRYKLKGSEGKTAKIMLRLKREDVGWTIKAIGKGCVGHNIQDIYSDLRAELHS